MAAADLMGLTDSVVSWRLGAIHSSSHANKSEQIK